MSDQILPAFWRFPKEGEIIGRLLAGYGDVEFEMALCLGAYLGDDDLGLRTVFTARGEDQRIRIADKLMRHAYEKVSLYEPYCEAISAMEHCKTIRNQYAHCHWYDTEQEGLCFTNLESWSKTKTALADTKRQPVDVPLLQRQEAYFRYVMHCFWFLAAEYRAKAGGPTNHIYKLPKKLDRPPRHNGSEKSEHPPTS